MHLSKQSSRSFSRRVEGKLITSLIQTRSNFVGRFAAGTRPWALEKDPLFI